MYVQTYVICCNIPVWMCMFPGYVFHIHFICIHGSPCLQSISICSFVAYKNTPTKMKRNLREGASIHLGPRPALLGTICLVRVGRHERHETTFLVQNGTDPPNHRFTSTPQLHACSNYIFTHEPWDYIVQWAHQGSFFYQSVPPWPLALAKDRVLLPPLWLQTLPPRFSLSHHIGIHFDRSTLWVWPQISKVLLWGIHWTALAPHTSCSPGGAPCIGPIILAQWMYVPVCITFYVYIVHPAGGGRRPKQS